MLQFVDCLACDGRKTNAIGEPCVRCQGVGKYLWTNDGTTQHLTPGRFGHGPAKSMCKECPLARTSVAGYLGGYSPEAYIAMLHGDADVACHLSPGFQDHPQTFATMRSCTGVAHYRANVGKLPRGKNGADAVKQAGVNREAAFASPAEFLAHHKPDNFK